MTERTYPRVAQFYRVNLSDRLAMEFHPHTGSWRLEEVIVAGDSSAVEAVSMVLSAAETRALRVVLGTGSDTVEVLPTSPDPDLIGEVP